MNSSNDSRSTKPMLTSGAQVVWYILWIVEIILFFRFILKLFGADFTSGFAGFVDAITYIFAAPFLNIFQVGEVAGGMVFEWTTIVAMLVYWFIAWGIIKLFIENEDETTSRTKMTSN